eukprot:2559533-Pyramimonas_sp.AAC.1
MGPGADERAQLSGPAAKWLCNAQILGEYHAPFQQNIKSYSSSALTTLSYVGQLFPVPELILTRETHVLHKINPLAALGLHQSGHVGSEELGWS